jgi:hypothetical protein
MRDKEKENIISEKPKQKIKEAVETNKMVIKKKLRCIFFLNFIRLGRHS